MSFTNPFNFPLFSMVLRMKNIGFDAFVAFVDALPECLNFSNTGGIVFKLVGSLDMAYLNGLRHGQFSFQHFSFATISCANIVTLWRNTR